MKQLILNEKETGIILEYLMQKPFKEVASIIVMIQSKIVDVPDIDYKMATPTEKE